jgi:hypothetical protein
VNLGFLQPLLDEPGPWASVYVDTSATAENFVPHLQLQARAAADRLAELGTDRDTCEAVHDALRDLSREAMGHAVFATAGRVVLDVPLPSAPASPPPVFHGPLPHLAPLLEHAGSDPTCLVAYVDRKGADLELRGTHRHPRRAGSVSGDTWPLHRRGTADWSERHFQLAVENTWEENAARIAETLARDAEQAHAELLVLAGDPRERREVRERLPESLRKVTVESERGSRAAGSDNRQLDREVEAARERRVREATEEALERFRAGRVPAHGRIDAAEGVPALADAAREHRIATLLVRTGGPDLHREVWAGHEPDQVAVRRTDLTGVGEREPVPVRADDALLRAAVATGAEVVPLPPADGADGDGELPVGGLGALLRWPYDGAVPGGGARPDVRPGV